MKQYHFFSGVAFIGRIALFGLVISAVLVSLYGNAFVSYANAATRQRGALPPSETECVPSPLSHLAAENIVISGGAATGKITNYSNNCTYSVGAASYKTYVPAPSQQSQWGSFLATQKLYDSAIKTVAPGQSVVFSVSLPDCAYQVDFFQGPDAPTPPDFEQFINTHTLLGWRISSGIGSCVDNNRIPEGYHEERSGEVTQSQCVASGWAVDPDSRGTRISVKIYSDGALVKTVTANGYRGDLRYHGLCTDGACGFSANLSKLISSNTPHVIRVAAVDVQTSRETDLSWTPKTLTCTAPVVQNDPLPTADIKANGQGGSITIPSGTSASITWSSTNAASCSVSPRGWTGVSGSQPSGNLTSRVIYRVNCTGPGGSASDSVTVNIAATHVDAPTVDIKANGENGPITISYNTAATITWNSTNASSCVVSPSGWTGVSGSQPSGNLIAQRTYTVQCTGAGGNASDSVTINVGAAPSPPTADIKANGSDAAISIQYNTAATLSWTSSNATSCTISPIGSSGVSGTISTGNLTSSQTYQISCTGAGGTATDSVAVNVASQPAAPTADIKANGSDGTITVAYNTQAAITWNSTNASSCVVSPSGWTGVSGSGLDAPNTSRTYTVQCNGTGGTATDTVTVNVSQSSLPIVDLSANRRSIVQGENSVLSWSSSNANSCSVSGGWSGLRSLSGAETTNPYVTTTYVITCINNFGVAQDSETIGVLPSYTYNPPQNIPSSIFITKRGLNRTLGATIYSPVFEAQGGDVIEFEIRVRNTDTSAGPVTVRDILPQGLSYINGSTRVDGVFVADGIITNISLGILQPNQERAVTFQARVLAGTIPQTIVNLASASMNSGTQTTTATITIRTRGTVLGAADIVTGPEDVVLWVLGFGFLGSLLTYYFVFARKDGWGLVGALRVRRIKGGNKKKDKYQEELLRLSQQIRKYEPNEQV